MKHILFLTWKDIKHSRAWWAEVVMYEYAKRLVKDGHKVTWFASDSESTSNSETLHGIEIIRKYSLWSIYFFAWIWYKWWRKQWNNPDIIIDEAGGIPLLSPLYEKNIPIYFFIHHIWESEWDKAFPYPLNIVFKKAMFKIIALYSGLSTLTVSQSTKQELIERFSFQDVYTIENASNISPQKEINFWKKQNEIIFLGRLMPIKRVEDAIHAFYFLYTKDPSYTLNIVWIGDETYTNSLKALAVNLWIKNSVVFCWYSEIIKSDKLLSSRAMLATSIKEGYGLVVIEANAFWLPVIGYDVPGLRDSIHEWVNGYLTEDWNTTELWSKLLELIEDDEQLTSLSQSSLDHVKSLWWWNERYEQFKKIILK